MSDANSKSHDSPTPDAGRRRFCQAALGGMTVVTVGTVSYPVFSFLRLPTSLQQREALEVAIDELPDGSAVWGDHMGRQIVILKLGGEVQAFDGACPHLGCIVQWDNASLTFKCPCHGAAFSDGGEPIYGPVNSPLEPVEFTIENGVLKIA